ncbi:ClpP/crotonase [Testicularia cyperi]|uniref:ClpP/crotonase n=1 Tax=Testicularia cyperi TaxID=1882483 RepID=A0A317XQV1_9BASI|nr:ClpP/crotonase [Testicularia cyperi]
MSIVLRGRRSLFSSLVQPSRSFRCPSTAATRTKTFLSRPVSLPSLVSQCFHSAPVRFIKFNISEQPQKLQPSGPMQSYSESFPSSGGDALVRVDFDGESRIWVLTMLAKDTPDNRLSHNLINNGLLPALAHVEQAWDKMVNDGTNDQGAALITTGGTDASAKIFSNGLDLEKAIADPHFFDRCLNNLYEKLMTFPVPTIASVNGHAFAGGFGLACAHDYRVMNESRGYLCMNEIDFGAPLPHGLQMALASKISDIKTMRKVVLEGHRFSAKEALEAGIIDATAAGQQATLDKSKQLADAIKGKAKMNVWAANKEVIYHPFLKVLRTKHEDSEEQLHTPRAKM